MPSGAERFCADRKGMLRSFLIPLLVLPLTLITVIAAHPDPNLSTDTAKVLMAVYSLRTVVYLSAFLGFVYFMAKGMDRLENFYRFATANNWLVLPATILIAPLVILFMNGAYSWSEVYPLMVFITLYSYAYTAFMATYVMRIPMELACFIAIAGMAINQTALDVMKWTAVNVMYLIS
ncbi:MAG: hypothetical protein DHS20C02_07870 [Micavibrio sp.]|nr:MAG: hypothetical protein DHS20C02_07870 [Micavibrio sp.]